MSISDKRIFYPLRPRKARSRPPILGGQLKTLVAKLKDKRTCGFKTKEQKNRFLRDRMGVVFWGDKRTEEQVFKVGCCFNEGLIRVLQTLDLVGVVCRAGGIASLYPRLFFRFASRASHDSMSRYLPPPTSQCSVSSPYIRWTAD